MLSLVCGDDVTINLFKVLSILSIMVIMANMLLLATF